MKAAAWWCFSLCAVWRFSEEDRGGINWILKSVCSGWPDWNWEGAGRFWDGNRIPPMAQMKRKARYCALLAWHQILRLWKIISNINLPNQRRIEYKGLEIIGEYEAGGTPHFPLQTKQLVPQSWSVRTANVRCPGFVCKCPEVRGGWVGCQGYAGNNERACSRTWYPGFGCHCTLGKAGEVDAAAFGGTSASATCYR